MRIVFLRHGEPNYADDCLTENGVVQAISTGKKLKSESIKAVYSSPLGRAKETASYVASEQGVDVQVLDFLHEINWGSKNGEGLEFDGHPWTLAYRLIAEHPDYLENDKWMEHPYFKNNICMDYYDKITGPFDELMKQYGLVRDGRVYRLEKQCDDTIAMVFHGGTGAVLFAHMFNQPLPYILTAMPFGVCSVTVISLTAENGGVVIPRFECFNDMSHLGQVRKEGLRFDK